MIGNIEQLDSVMSEPTPALIEFVKTLDSPLVVLGAGGKMGPSLCVLAKRALDAANHDVDVIAVSRFSDVKQKQWLESRGVKAISADLMDESVYDHLPDTKNVIYLVGFKFGSSAHPARTWAINTLVPAYVAKRYQQARIVALSTGNVYPFVGITSGGCTEAEALAPVGEYAQACMARERIFQYFSEERGNQIALIRLNYATDLRYGVLVDIVQRVQLGTIDVTNGFFNCIWQRDANDMIIRALALTGSPSKVWNLTGLETESVRERALEVAQMIGTSLKIEGEEAPTALLSNAHALSKELGAPSVSTNDVLEWTVNWLQQNQPTLQKPTHFEVRDGKF